MALVDSCANMDANEVNTTIVSTLSNYRKMIGGPALKILAEHDPSDKSFLVLVSVMERCCKQGSNQGVFLGCGKDEAEQKLAFGIYILV